MITSSGFERSHQDSTDCRIWERLKSTRRRISILVGFILLVGGSGVANASCDSCLIQLSTKASLYDRISVVDSNSTTIHGTLTEIDLKKSRLTLSQSGSRHLLQYSICGDKVTRLGYQKRGKPNPYLMVAGFFIGQIFGKLVENVLDPGYDIRMELLPFQRPVGNEDGTWVGAIAGLGVGVLVPMMIPTERSFPCYDPLNTGEK